jgi:tetratricopeptide (TPR) repeat protein
MISWYLAAGYAASLAVTPYRAAGDLTADVRCPPAARPGFGGPDEALGWLDRELMNALEVARLAREHGSWRAAWQLADIMWPAFLYLGRLAERLEFDATGLDAARQDRDPLGEAKMLYRLGSALAEDGQHDRAEACIRDAMSAWEQLGRPDRVAGAQRRLGVIDMKRGDPGRAAGWFAQALDGYRQAGDSRHVAVALSSLGDALTAAGRAPEALRALTEAMTLLSAAPDPHSQALLLIRMGRARAAVPGNPEAAGYLSAALALARQAGDLRAQAEALTALGDLATSAGQAGEARQRYTEADHVRASLRSPLSPPGNGSS